MTAPRRVLPGQTYLVTRRCAQRQFLLKPSRATNDTFLYVLAVAADRFEIDVHAYCVWSAPERIGGTSITVRRPKHFFDPNGSMPEEITLELTVPRGFGSPEEFRTLLAAALEEREARASEEYGGRFLGVAAVLAQAATARPLRREARGGLDPRIAARDKWKRIEVLGRLIEFLRSYRAAWAEYVAGATDVVFPAGTYGMRVVHGVRCEAYG